MCHKLELLTPETMRLLGSTKKGADKDKETAKKCQNYNLLKLLKFCLLLLQTKNLDR